MENRSLSASHHTIAAHRLVGLAKVNTASQDWGNLFFNSRSLKFSKKYPQETRKRRDFIMSTPSISGLTIFIVILNLEDILRNFLVLLFPNHIMSL